MTVRRYTAPVAIPLTPDDRLARAEAIATAAKSRPPLQLELERYKAGAKAARERLDAITEEILAHSAVLASGEHEVQVEHEDRPHRERPVWQVFRRAGDGWELIAERPMTPDERQLLMATVPAPSAEVVDLARARRVAGARARARREVAGDDG